MRALFCECSERDQLAYVDSLTPADAAYLLSLCDLFPVTDSLTVLARLEERSNPEEYRGSAEDIAAVEKERAERNIFHERPEVRFHEDFRFCGGENVAVAHGKIRANWTPIGSIRLIRRKTKKLPGEWRGRADNAARAYEGG